MNVSPILFSLSALSLGAILWTTCVAGTLPPAGMGTSQFFWFLIASGALSLANLGLLITHARQSQQPFRLNFGLLLTRGPQPQYPFRPTWGDCLALLLGGYISLSAASPLSRWEILLLLGLYINVRLFASARHKHALQWLIALLLLLGLTEEIIGLRQLYGYAPSNHNAFRVTGTFHNPAPLGGFLAMILGLSLWQLKKDYKTIPRALRILRHRSLNSARIWIFMISCLSLVGIALLMPATQSRIAWLAALVAVVAIGYSGLPLRHLRDRIARHKKAAIVSSLAILGISTCITIAAYRMKADSADGRLLMWKTTAAIIADHPLTGVGYSRYAGAYGDYQARYFATGSGTPGQIRIAGSTGSAFNDYLQCAAELGLVGLLLFGGLTVLAFRGYRRSGQGRFSAGGLPFALLALLIYATASYPLQLLSFRILWVILVATGLSLPPAPSSTSNFPGRWSAPIAWAIAVAISIGSLWLAWPLRNAYREWKQLQPLYQSEHFEKVRDSYAGLLSTLSHELQFQFEYANILSKTGSYAASNTILQAASRQSSDPMIYNLMGNNHKARHEYAAAESAYWRAYWVIPNRIYPLYLLAELYAASGESGKMREMATRVLEFDEKVSSTAVREIKANARRMLDTSAVAP